MLNCVCVAEASTAEPRSRIPAPASGPCSLPSPHLGPTFPRSPAVRNFSNQLLSGANDVVAVLVAGRDRARAFVGTSSLVKCATVLRGS